MARLLRYLMNGLLLLITVLGGLAAADYFLDGLLREMLRWEYRAAWDWSWAAPILAACLAVALMLSIVKRRSDWRTWCQQCRVAAQTSDFSLSELQPLRRMDIPYVSLKRTLTRPAAFGLAIRDAVSVTQDAEPYLHDLVTQETWRSTHSGFLLEGAVMVGKTRFAGEWIRKHLPDSLVIVPDPDVPPSPHPALRRFRQHGVCLLLDDLNEYISISHQLCRFLDHLRKWRVPVTIVATVRNGGPAAEILTETTFRGLYKSLDHFLLAPPRRDQMRRVERSLGGTSKLEATTTPPSFAWLLENQFSAMRIRFSGHLPHEARALMYAGRLLDWCGIPLSKERWLSVARDVLDLSGGPVEEMAAIQALRAQGFLLGTFPDPAYLEHVVNGDFHPKNYVLPLEDSLRRRKDGMAFLYWGKQMADVQHNLTASSHYLELAVGVFDEGAWPAILDAVAMSRVALGSMYFRAERFDEAITTWRDAVKWGRKKGGTGGQLAVANASFGRGVALRQLGRLDEARTAFEESVAAGRQSELPGARETADLASQSLARLNASGGSAPERRDPKVRRAEDLFRRGVALQDSPSKAIPLWRKALQEIGDLDTSEAQEVAACVNMALGSALAQQGNVEEAERHWMDAMRKGETCDTVEGKSVGATAAFNHGICRGKAGDAESAATCYRAAIRLGARSDAQGKDIAIDAGFNLGSILNEIGNPSEAVQTWREAVALGHTSSSSRGKRSGSFAALNLATVLGKFAPSPSASEEDIESAFRAAITLGKGSACTEGTEVALQASLNCGAFLREHTRHKEALHIWRQAIRLALDAKTKTNLARAASAASNHGYVWKKDLDDSRIADLSYLLAAVLKELSEHPESNELGDLAEEMLQDLTKMSEQWFRRN